MKLARFGPFAVMSVGLLVACGGADHPAADGNHTAADGNHTAADGNHTAADGNHTPPYADATIPAGDPGADGPHTVSETDVSIPVAGGSVSATLYLPDGAGPYPLAVISPGFQMPRTQYASYGRHLASWGFVALAQDFPGGFFVDHADLAAQTIAVIDWAVSPAGPAGPAGPAVDPAKIGTVGHSLGGKISVYAAAEDARISAVVGWDPVDSTSPSVVPEMMSALSADVAVLGETLNGSGGFMPCAPTAENFQQFYDAAPSPALEITVIGADHMDWVDDTSCGLCGFCSPAGTADEEEVRRLTRRTTVAWLRSRLLGDAAMEPWLTGAKIAADIASGNITVRSK